MLEALLPWRGVSAALRRKRDPGLVNFCLEWLKVRPMTKSQLVTFSVFAVFSIMSGLLVLIPAGQGPADHSPWCCLLRGVSAV